MGISGSIIRRSKYPQFDEKQNMPSSKNTHSKIYMPPLNFNEAPTLKGLIKCSKISGFWAFIETEKERKIERKCKKNH